MKVGGRTEAEVEGRGRVEDDFQAGRLDHLVERRGDGDVRDDGDGEGARGGLRGVGFADLGGLVLVADCGHDAVAFGEELLEDVGGDEAGAPWGVCQSGVDTTAVTHGGTHLSKEPWSCLLVLI